LALRIVAGIFRAFLLRTIQFTQVLFSIPNDGKKWLQSVFNSLIRAGSIDGWDKLIAAVKEALRLGISDAAAVLHLLRMPDPEQRRQYSVALAEELLSFERPMPVMDESRACVAI
jgi:hypothetical protein